MSTVCERCDTSLRFEERRINADGGTHGHHLSVYYCPTCDREVLRG